MSIKASKTMEQLSQSAPTDEPRTFLHPRWIIITAGLAIQLFVLGAVLVSMQQPQTPDLSLAPLAGKPGVCQVVAVRPFSDAWVHGVQAGIQVRITGPDTTATARSSPRPFSYSW